MQTPESYLRQILYLVGDGAHGCSQEERDMASDLDEEMFTFWYEEGAGDVEIVALQHTMQTLAHRALQGCAEKEREIGILRGLLDEAYVKVDADEEAQAQSWPEEIESGELVLDLAERIEIAVRAGPRWMMELERRKEVRT